MLNFQRVALSGMRFGPGFVPESQRARHRVRPHRAGELAVCVRGVGRVQCAGNSVKI